MTTSMELLHAIEPLANDHGIEVVTVEVTGSRKSPTIRVYIDTEDGVDLGVLASAQEWIGELMDEIDPFPGAYTLEVSSPGIDRPLRTLDHFRRYVGETAQLRTTEQIEGRASFKGIISDVDESDVVLDVDGSMHHIPIRSIKRANLIGKIEFR